MEISWNVTEKHKTDAVYRKLASKSKQMSGSCHDLDSKYLQSTDDAQWDQAGRRRGAGEKHNTEALLSLSATKSQKFNQKVEWHKNLRNEVLIRVIHGNQGRRCNFFMARWVKAGEQIGCTISPES